MKKMLCLVLTVIMIPLLLAGSPQSEKSRMHYKLGLSYYERNDFKNAITEFKEAVKLNPTNSNIHYSLGTSYLSIGNYVEAIKSLETSIQYNPNNPDAFYNLGIAAYRTRQYNKAINSFKNAISLNPNDIDYYINLGVIYRITGKYPEAIIEYQKALFIKPSSIPALLNLGVAYRLNGNIDRAIEQYQKVLSIDPDNKEALYNISLIEKAHNISIDRPVPSRTRVSTPTQQQRFITPPDPISVGPAVRQPVSPPAIPVYDATRPMDRERISPRDTDDDFEKKLFDTLNDFRTSIVKEVREITDSAVKTIKIQNEEFQKSLNDLRREIEYIKTGEMPPPVAETKPEITEPRTVEELHAAQMELLKNEIRELSIQNRELRNEIRSLRDEDRVIARRRDTSRPDTTRDTIPPRPDTRRRTPSVTEPTDTRRRDDSVEDLLRRLGLDDDFDRDTRTDRQISTRRVPSESVPSHQRVNINNASVNELTSLPNINQAKATNIVWYRENIANFRRADEIIRVPGITLDDMYNLSSFIAY